MRFYRKVYFLKTYQYWFKGNWKPYHLFSFSAFLNMRTGLIKKPLCFQENSYSLKLDLLQDLTIIYSNFAKQVRQQTTQAINEGITFHIQNDLSLFKTFYNEFAVKKNIFIISERRMKEMEDNIYFIFAQKDGDILAAHSYLFDKEVGIVSHLHSASRRLDDRYDAKIISKANKFLTSKSIEYFKEQGYSVFDFGGIRYPLPEAGSSGINNYKMLFGGEIYKCYNTYTPLYYILKQLGKNIKFLGKKASL